MKNFLKNIFEIFFFEFFFAEMYWADFFYNFFYENAERSVAFGECTQIHATLYANSLLNSSCSFGCFFAATDHDDGGNGFRSWNHFSYVGRSLYCGL
jgi:hypothetical protein